MQSKVGAGGAIVAGTATRDAEFKTVGGKGTPRAAFSLAINSFGEPAAYASCKVFGRLANYARGIRKGDSVCAAGVIESREYNGKEYKDLNCQWLNFVGQGTPAAAPPPPPELSGEAMRALYSDGDSDDDLPF